jgi:hypothetical protein
LAVYKSTWKKSAWAIAAGVVIAVSLSAGYVYGRRSGDRDGGRSSRQIPAPAVEHQFAMPTGAAAPSTELERITQLNAKLRAQLADLSAIVRGLNIRITSSQADLQSTFQERQALVSQHDGLEAQLKAMREDLARSETALVSARQEAANLRDHSTDMEVALADERDRIRGLSEQLTAKSSALDQEHQLLAVGHDVTDLMGARNLHIVDVVDTDLHGKTRPAFGRVFFTEGKSLIFYAYDLNEARIEKANYQYRVWAKKEGGDKKVRNLGIFYSDNKAERRWAFKCTDQKVLSEIDSVFVTLEPAGSDPIHPNGPNLMYAYLRGQPNHP